MSMTYRYPEDPTGANPDNLVSGERRSLEDRPIRVAIPKYSPFFTASLVVYDSETQKPLVKGVDYQVPVILQEATLRYGMEVGDALLILNPAVSSTIILTYQAVGGPVQNNIDNLVKLYDGLMNDTRGIDWQTGVFGKPASYPPSPHPTQLSDIYGFEPLTFALERIQQAILLGNTPAYEMLFEALKANVASKQEIEAGDPLPKFLTLEGLIAALDQYNFNSMVVKPMTGSLSNGASLWFDVTASNVPDNVSLFWTIEKESAQAYDFVANSGVFSLTNGVGRFMIQAVFDQEREGDEIFRVAVRKTRVDGHILAKTRPITLIAHSAYRDGTILESLRIPNLNSPRLKINATTYAVHQRNWLAEYN